MGNYSFVGTPWGVDPYVFEARDGDGALVDYIRNVLAAEITTRVNEPATLTMEIRQDNRAAEALQGRNEIYVRPEGADSAAWAFSLRRTVERWSDGVLEVVGVDRMARLASEYVIGYSEEATIGAHVAAWLGSQTQRPAVTLGGIDSAISGLVRSYEAPTGETVLHAIRSLDSTLTFKTIYYVDWRGRLYWEVADSAIENYLLLDRHCREARRKVDYDGQVTRLYMYGANEGGERVRLSQAEGQAKDYVEATAAPWRYRLAVAIHPANVDAGDGAVVSDYTLWLDLSSDASLARYAQEDGSDLAAFDVEGNRLGLEINAFDGSTGALEAWVGPLDVSAVVETVVYLYFGGAAGSGVGGAVSVDPGAQSDAWQATWSANIGAPNLFYSVGRPVSLAGERSAVEVAEQFTDPDALLEYARWRLAVAAEPVVGYEIKLLNIEALRRHPGWAYTLGRRQRVVDLDLSIDTKQYIVGARVNLLNPAESEFDLGRRIPRDSGLIGAIESIEMDDLTDWLDDEDVYLGDGQTYPLSDWHHKADGSGGRYFAGDDTGLIDCRKVLIAENPAFGWPDGDLALLSDWRYGPLAGYIDGAKVRGLPSELIHQIRIGMILSGEVTGGAHKYVVEIWERDGSAALSPQVTVSDVLVADNSIDKLDDDQMVVCYVPGPEDAGNAIILGAGIGGQGDQAVPSHGHSGSDDGGDLDGWRAP